MVQCCVWLSPSVSVVCTECIVAKRCGIELKLLLTAYRESYEKSIGTKRNDYGLCLEVISRSCQPLRYIRRWISRKPLEIESWFQRTTNRKWHMGYHKWSRDRWRHTILKSQTHYPNTPRAQYLENGWRERICSKGPPIGNNIWGIKWIGLRKDKPDAGCYQPIY